MYKELFCERSPSKLLKQNPWKIPKEKFIFSKVAGSHVFFKILAKSLSNLVHDYWERCFSKPELLLAANRLVYLNI